MYLHIRKKKNKSGSISIQIVDRKNRKYKVIETIGCARNDKELEILLKKAEIRFEDIRKKLYPSIFDIVDKKEKDEIEFLSISNNELVPIGDKLIFGEMFDKLGCKKLKDILKGRYKIFITYSKPSFLCCS
jgi:predicted nucleic acid-binding OB-fold protein